jgi:hypothetical protein
MNGIKTYIYQVLYESIDFLKTNFNLKRKEYYNLEKRDGRHIVTKLSALSDYCCRFLWAIIVAWMPTTRHVNARFDKNSVVALRKCDMDIDHFGLFRFHYGSVGY